MTGSSLLVVTMVMRTVLGENLVTNLILLKVTLLTRVMVTLVVSRTVAAVMVTGALRSRY